MSPIRHSNINTRSLKSPNTPLKASVVILTAVILAACGSSGSGSVTPKPIPMPPGSGTDTGGTGNGTGNNGGSTDNGTGNGGTGTGDNGSGTVTGPDTTEAKKQEEEALKAEAAAAKAAAEAAKAEVDAQILANSQTASNAQIEAAKKAAAEAKARAEAAEAAAKDARAKAEAEINKVVADSEARAKAAEEATKAAQAAKTKAEAAAAAAEKAKAEAIKAKEAAEKALEEGGNNDGSAGGNSEALQKEAERKAKLAKDAADAATAQANAATKASAEAAAKESAAAAATKAASDAANAAKIKNAPESTKTGVQSLNVNGGALGVFSTTTRDFTVSKDGSVVEARADIASQDPKTPGKPGLLPKVSMITSTANDTDLKDGFKEYKGNAEIVVATLGQTLPLDYVSTYKEFGDDMRIGHIDGGAEVTLLKQTLPVNGVAVMGNATQVANVPTDGTAKYSGDATYRKLGLGNDIEFGKSVFTADFVAKKVAGDLKFAKAGNIGISATIAGNQFAGSKDGYNTEGGFYGGDAQYLGGVYEGKDAQGTYGATSDKQTKAEQNVKTAQTAAQDAAKALAEAKAQATAAQAAAAKAQADAAKAKADADKAQAAADNAGNGADALQDALDRAAAAEAAQAAAEKAAAEAVSAAKAEAAAAKTAADAAKVEADAKVAAAEKLASQGNAAATAANKAANEAKARADAAEATAKSAEARVKAAEAEVKAALEAKTSAEAQAKAAEAAIKNAQAATNAAQAAKAKAEAATAAAEKAKAEAIKAKQDTEQALEDALSSGGSSEALQKEADRKAKLAEAATAAAKAAATAQTQAAADAAAKATAADAAKTKATQAAAATKIKNAPEANKTGVQSLNIDAKATLGTAFNTTTRDFMVNADGSVVEARADIASQLDPAEPGLLPKVSVTVSGANDANLQNGFKAHTDNAEIYVEALQQTLPLDYVSTYKDFGNDMRIAHIDGAANVELLGATLPVDGVAVLGNATQAANVPKEGSLKYSGDATYRELGLDNDIEFGKSVFTADFVGKKVAGDLNFAKAGNIGLSANIAGNKFSGTKGGYNTQGGFYGGDAQYIGGVYTSDKAQGTFGATSDKQTKAEEAVKTAQTQSQAATKALEAAQAQATATQAALEKAQADAVKAQKAAVKAQEAADNGGGGEDVLQAALDRASAAEAAATKAEADATKAVAAAEAAAAKASAAAQAEVKAAQAATAKAQTEAATAKAAAETAKTEAAAKVAAAQKAAKEDIDAANAAVIKAQADLKAAEDEAIEAEAKATAAEEAKLAAETRAKTAEDALAAAIKLPPTPKNPEVAADSTISGLQSNNMNGYQTNAVGGVVENNSSSFDILTSRVNELGSKYASTPVDLVLRNKAADSDYDEQFKQHSGKVSVKGTGELNEGVNRDLNYTSVYKNFDEVMQIGHVYGTIKRTLYEDGKLSTVYAEGKATNQKDMDYLKEAAQYNAKNGINDGKVDYEGVATYIANSNVAGPIVGDSKFKVDFVDQQVDGTLSFDSVGEKKIKAEITGNTFQGNWNGVNAQGGFYGEDAGLLGGIYQDSKGKGTYGASKITPEPVDPVEPEPEVPIDPTKPPINPTAAVDNNVSGIMSNTLSSKDKKVLNIQATVDRIGYRQFVNDKQTVTGVNGKDDNGGIPTVKESSKENNFIDYKTFKPRVDVTSPDQFVEANRDNITTVRSNDVDAGNGFKKSASKNVANFKNVQTGVSLAPTADLVLNYDSVYKNFNSQMQIGHVYGDLDKPSGTGSGISSRYSNVYAIGNSTAQADMDYMAALAKFNKANGINDGKFQYAGVATYIDQLHLAEVANPTTSTPRNAPILNGTSAFDVDFVGGKVGGKLNFTGKPQLDIAADITGNTFAGTAKGIETAGGFFGEDAKFLGGIYQDNPGNGGAGGKAGTGTKFQGTFGAEKQQHNLTIQHKKKASQGAFFLAKVIENPQDN